MPYYDDVQQIAQVDTADTVLGSVERWHAHQKGILHRALTITVFFQDFVLLQHRKHPVFDNVFDMTVSSHQRFEGDQLEHDRDAVTRTLERELGISPPDLAHEPIQSGTIVYKARDSRSAYIEHEVCHIYTCTIHKLPQIDMEVAYGFSLQKIIDLKDGTSPLTPLLAPWVTVMLKEKVI